MREESLDRGGRAPSPIDVLRRAWREFGERLGDHVLASLVAHAIGAFVMLGAYIGFSAMGSTLVSIWMTGSMTALAVLSQLATDLGVPPLPPDVALALGVGTWLGWIAVTLAGILALVAVFFPVLLVALAPVHAGWLRALTRPDGRIRAGDILPLSFRGLPSVLLCASVIVLATCAMLVTGPGALIPPLVLGFAPSLVAIHGMPWWRALATSARHAVANPRLHLGYMALWLAVAAVAVNVPVLGTAFAVALHARMHGILFGDGAALFAGPYRGAATGPTPDARERVVTARGASPPPTR